MVGYVVVVPQPSLSNRLPDPIPMCGGKNLPPHHQTMLRTPTWCPPIQLSSDTIYLEIASDSTGEVLSPTRLQFSSVQSLSRVQLFATTWIAARKASLSITNSRSLLKLMSIESVMPSSHLILCHPLLLLPPIIPSIRVFSSESTLHMRWPKYWSFNFSISPSNEHPGLISLGWTGWISLQSRGLSRVFSNTTVQNHQFFGAQLSSQSNSHIHTWPLEKP